MKSGAETFFSCPCGQCGASPARPSLDTLAGWFWYRPTPPVTLTVTDWYIYACRACGSGISSPGTCPECLTSLTASHASRGEIVAPEGV